MSASARQLETFFWSRMRGYPDLRADPGLRANRNLDSRGIVRVGSEVRQRDLLMGKIRRKTAP